MDRDSMNDGQGPRTHELTEAELDAVSGGMSAGGDRPSESLTTIGSATGGAGAGNAIIAILIG